MKSAHAGIPPLLRGDNLVFEDLEKANMFNDYSASKGLPDDSNARLPNIPANDVNRLENIVIRERDVFDASSILNSTKASGPDLIRKCLVN